MADIMAEEATADEDAGIAAAVDDEPDSKTAARSLDLPDRVHDGT